MNYYKACFQYDGTAHSGFQWQLNIPSIQNDINLALESLLGEKCTTMGSSRTDSGVHARQQFVKITTESDIGGDFVDRLNRALPPGIRCLSVAPCEGSYRPATVSVSKEYRYFFTNSFKEDVKHRRFIANNPYPINFSAMKICTEMLVGTHSFHNFASTGSNVKTFVREILFCELSVVDPRPLFADTIFDIPASMESCYQLRIVGKGFLKQMVRHLMTALWLVGNGKLTPEEFHHLVMGPKQEGMKWKVAPAKGLFLWETL